MKRIKVLVVDDSAVVREFLSSALCRDPHIEVVGVAPDPYLARDKILKLNPDVLTLDVEMPRMNGLTFLEKLMKYYPIPVVMVSSMTQRGAEITMKALEVGAVDFVAKPERGDVGKLEDLAKELIEKVKVAAQARINWRPEAGGRRRASGLQSQEVRRLRQQDIGSEHKIIAMGASTGGTQAIREILAQMPADSPGIVIVQHMPEQFTQAFAQRLNTLCAMEVREAGDGDGIHRGLALIAPGNKHMVVKRGGIRYFVTIEEGPRVYHQRPSVDVLFTSVAYCAGFHGVGVLLTGMGKDGAHGLLKMKEAGAWTVVQDEASCVVFGMPAEAIKLGAADKILSLDKIPETLLTLCKKEKSNGKPI